MKRKLLSILTAVILLVSVSVIVSGCGGGYDGACDKLQKYLEKQGNNEMDGMSYDMYESDSGDLEVYSGEGGVSIQLYQENMSGNGNYVLSLDSYTMIVFNKGSEFSHDYTESRILVSLYEELDGIEKDIHGTIESQEFTDSSSVEIGEVENNMEELDQFDDANDASLQSTLNSNIYLCLRVFAEYLEQTNTGLTLADFGFPAFE
ncbi:MAG: hypothetical protein Q4D99_07915 [Bacillota bacterium]|nr:hypothetical protein [Bacillota bacterium]